MDETLEQGIKDRNGDLMMVLRPNIDELVAKLQEAKKQGSDIILCTTANELWVNRFLELKSEFRDLFSKVFNYDNKRDWKDFDFSRYPLESRFYAPHAKPITTFGYDSILFIDDAPSARDMLEKLFEDSWASYRLECLCEMYPDEAEKFYDDPDEDIGDDENYDRDILEKMLNIISSKRKNCIIPSKQIDVTYFSGFGFFLDSSSIEEILECINDPNLTPEISQKIAQYMEHINREQGCQMMCSEIDTFMKKEFIPGLTLADEKYFEQYKKYQRQARQLESELRTLGAGRSKCPDSVINEYMSTDKSYPFEGISIEKTSEITPALAAMSLAKRKGVLDEISKADYVEAHETNPEVTKEGERIDG